MNIFVLDESPMCGHFLVDKHVVKMPLETAQMLSTAIGGGQGLYKPAYIHHPCTRWAGESRENFLWLVRHGLAICDEYESRYGRRHKSRDVIMEAFRQSATYSFVHRGRTPFVCAMPDEFKVSDDAVTNYREYYVKGKAHIAEWRRNKPEWYDRPDYRTFRCETNLAFLLFS